MSHEPCTGEGKRALHPDPVTRTGVCPDCGGIRPVELPDEGNYVMDFHTVLVIDFGDDDDLPTTQERAKMNFSTTINGRDLRETIIDRLHNEAGDSVTGVLGDPATIADEIMVTLGFDSGYDDDGDYAEGYREYMQSVGLLTERGR